MDGRIERASAPGSATKLRAHECSHLRAAAHYATRVYPGAIGELLARELRAHADFGYRFDSSGLLLRVAREVLALPVPYDAEQAS